MPAFGIVTLLSCASRAPAPPPVEEAPAALQVNAVDGRRRALIVTIQDYSYDDDFKYSKEVPEGGWWDLHSNNDAELIGDALNVIGFDEVKFLKDAEATREGIVQAIRTELVDNSKPGDHVVFHYSGHGQQIFDESGDESDGADEALVAYGAPIEDTGGYDYSQHLSDDELGELLAEVRAAVYPGGSVSVFIDSCHSGTITRGGVSELAVRGGPYRIGVQPGPAAPDERMFDEVGPGELAPMVVITASQSHQVATETYDERQRPVGLLSYSLADALVQPRPEPTWGAVYERVELTMARIDAGQPPTFQGAGDSRLFDGSSLSIAPYFQVQETVDGGTWISGGRVHGLAEGAMVELHAPGTVAATDEGVLATGQVQRLEGTRALVRWESEPGEALEGGRVFVQHWGRQASRLALQLELAEEQAQAWSAAIGGERVLELAEGSPDLVLRSEGGRVVALKPGTGAVVADFAAPDQDALKTLRSLAYGQLIGEVSLNGSQHQSWMSLQPTDASCQPLEGEDFEVVAGRTQIPIGSHYRVVVHNRASEPSWLTVVHTDVGGSPEVFYPYEEERPFLRQDQDTWASASCFQAQEPAGTESVKLFATKMEMHLDRVLPSAVADLDMPSTRGGGEPQDAFDLLMGELDVVTRGAARKAPSRADGWTYGLVFDTVEP